MTHTRPLGTEDIKLLNISDDIDSKAIFAASNKSSLVLQFSRLIFKLTVELESRLIKTSIECKIFDQPIIYF